MDKKMHGVIMQTFEWYLRDDCSHWDKLAQMSAELSKVGITAVWLPPAYKGQGGKSDVGYGVYDIYDLGEFDQKGSIATKYGSREQYLNCIKKLQENDIDVYCDIVLNHMMGADEAEKVMVIEKDSSDRTKNISEPEEISAWTKFTFAARGGKYNDFIWTKECFDGIDWDQQRQKAGIYNFEGVPWDSGVDKENENYDYLMGADLCFGNKIVVNQLLIWGDWYVRTTGLDGFRLDAVKHIDYNFYPKWLGNLRYVYDKEFFAVGEYWHNDINVLKKYLENTGECMSLFDVPLHNNFHIASTSNGNFDLRNIFKDTLTKENPGKSVTFVDNHDTQKGQALQSPVENWFIPHAYSLILLRDSGYPCIFYGHYFGMEHSDVPAFKETIDKLLFVRHNLMYGKVNDYFDEESVIGWSFEGDEKSNNDGFAVILTDSAQNEKKIYVGEKHKGQIWVDILGNSDEKVTIGEDGIAAFKVQDGSVSVYCKEEIVSIIKF